MHCKGNISWVLSQCWFTILNSAQIRRPSIVRARGSFVWWIVKIYRRFLWYRAGFSGMRVSSKWLTRSALPGANTFRIWWTRVCVMGCVPPNTQFEYWLMWCYSFSDHTRVLITTTSNNWITFRVPFRLLVAMNAEQCPGRNAGIS